MPDKTAMLFVLLFVVVVRGFGSWYTASAQLSLQAAPEELPAWAARAEPARRLALLIAIDEYDELSGLSGPPNDVEMLEQSLSRLGFDVAVRSGRVDKTTVFEDVTRFARALLPGDVAFVYYSGHGIERDGNFYIVPSQTEMTDLVEGREARALVSLARIEQLVSTNRPRLFFVFDACRKRGDVDANFEEREETEQPGEGPGIGAGDPQRKRDPTAKINKWASEAAGEPDLVGSVGFFETNQNFFGYATTQNGVAWGRFKDDPVTEPSLFTRHFAPLLDGMDDQDLFRIWNRVEYVVSRAAQDANKEQLPRTGDSAAIIAHLGNHPDLLARYDENWRNVVREVEATSIGQKIERLRQYMYEYPTSPWLRTAQRYLIQITDLSDNAVQSPRPEIYSFDRSVGRAPPDNLTLYAGAVRSSVIGPAVGENSVYTTEPVVLRQNPTTFSRPLEAIPEGASLSIIEVVQRQERSWGKVLTESGYTGYIENVQKFDNRLELESATADADDVLEALRNSAPLDDSVESIFRAVDSTDRAVFVQIGREGAELPPPDYSSMSALEKAQLADLRDEQFRLELAFSAYLRERGVEQSLVVLDASVSDGQMIRDMDVTFSLGAETVSQ